VSEADIQRDIMLEATRLGHRLFRNNVGRARYRRGKDEFAVPYGVGGVGGADLIGWTTVRILYRVIETLNSSDNVRFNPMCRFTAIECKGPRGSLTGEQEQFLSAVREAGGIAGVCRSVSDYRKLIGAEWWTTNIGS